MSLTNFTNIQAAEVQLKMEQIWKEPSTSKDYSPRANSLKTILENQTATISQLENPTELREVSLKWVDFCADTSADGTYDDDCDTTKQAEGVAKKKEYALDLFTTDSFSVAVEELEKSVISYDEIVATGMARKVKSMLERANSKCVAAIDANRGSNPFAGGYTVDNVTEKDTEIPAADFGGEKLIPYLAQVAELNRSNSVYLLDGGNLFQDYYKAGKNARNADGKLADAFYEDLPYRHDLFGFSANNLSAFTYLIDKGAFAIANRAKFPALASLAGRPDGGWIHTSKGNMMRYSIPLNIPGIPAMTFVSQGGLMKQNLLVDVQYAVVCHTDGKLYHTWMLKMRWGIFANPLRCSATNTGVIKFEKVA